MVVVNGENSRLQNGVFATWVSEGVLMTLYASSFTAATAVLAMSSTYSMINDFNSRFSSLSGYVEKLLFHFHSKTQKKQETWHVAFPCDSSYFKLFHFPLCS